MGFEAIGHGPYFLSLFVDQCDVRQCTPLSLRAHVKWWAFYVVANSFNLDSGFHSGAGGGKALYS